MSGRKDKFHSFATKWSPAILEHGFTAIPNLLFSQRKELKVTAPEFLVLAAIESFRWDTNDPWPSLNALSRRTGYSTKSITRHVGSLQQKKLVKRIPRKGTSNKYNLQPLIDKLDLTAISVLPPGKERPPTMDKTSLYNRTKLYPKEYSNQKTQIKNTSKNNGIESIGKNLKKRYLS